MKRTALMRRTPLARTGRLSPVSAKRRKEGRIYSQKRKSFLKANKVCWAWIRLANDGHFEVMREIWGEGFDRAQPSEDVHHTAGRYDGNYLDETTWMPVSRRAHDWIHANPKAAEARGWIVRAKPISRLDGSAAPTSARAEPR